MKTYRHIFVLAFMLLSAAWLQARGVRMGTVEDIKVVAKLPRTETYKIGNDFIDLGAKYTAFRISGMNTWIKEEPRLVGVSVISPDTYYDLSPEEIKFILADQKLDEKKLLQLSLWERYGGLLLFIPAIGLLFLIRRFSQSGKEDEIIYPEGEGEEKKENQA